MNTFRHNDLVLVEVEAVGPLLASDQDAVDLIGSTYGTEADVIVLPLDRLDPRFLDLKSGIAGVFFQKMQNYQLRLVVVGDIATALEASRSLHDFVYETNRLGHHLFVPDHATMLARL